MADSKAAPIGFEGAPGGQGPPPPAGAHPPPPGAQPMPSQGVPGGVPGGQAPPPPTYNQAVLPPGGFILSYVDFVPEQHEKFNSLLARANHYLAQNPGYKAKSCESYEIKGEQTGIFSTGRLVVNSTSSTYTEYGNRFNFYCRCLRLWLEPKQAGDPPEPQVICYTTSIPGCLDAGGFLSTPKFEEFHIMVNKLNEYLSQNPLSGRILNIDTQDVKFHSWTGSIDPDETFWCQRERIQYYLTILRIFYIQGPPAYEIVGSADFVPRCISEGGFASWPRFENFQSVVTAAHMWIKQQQGRCRVINVQSVSYKMKRELFSGTSLNTQKSLHWESGKTGTINIRIMRAYFSTSTTFTPDPVPHLAYRNFHPALTAMGGMFSSPYFEIQPENLKRVMAWLNYNRAKVFSVETVPVKIWPGAQGANPEDTLEYDSPNYETYVFVVRLYLDGLFPEPPADAMPPVPQVAQASNDCCNIL